MGETADRTKQTCLRRLQESVKMSKSEESLNEEAIFLCLVRGCVVSA